MASISASISTSSPSFSLLQKPTTTAHGSPVLGLPSMSKMGKVRCSMEGKPAVTSDDNASKLRMGASSLMAAAVAATMSSPAAMALVDERMSTEGTGLPFGLSNNLLGWILFGVFGLIWTLYFVYVGGLDEDEESGLSL
ncbi:putative photosystem II PsbW, class 2 [Helianthus annuus]|nr:putative photosystem II PsbW, class 2 [Helianthus annuus]KAJ0946490.1 putative photosystem II PsbW, class 2 [Helianthus annuus]KAJ0955533.1 putative photosystem II PsbW, class 2 [Helianthus annuus]